MQEHLGQLRKRLYPILSQWQKHNLTEQDNTYGFYRLDELKRELDDMEGCIRKSIQLTTTTNKSKQAKVQRTVST